MLELQGISKSFGGLKAVSNCSFEVRRGTITGLIGPNGAGKTTTLSMIAGELKPDTGEISFDGKRIDGAAPYVIARSGVYRTFQLARELGGLTVMENVLLASYPQPGERLLWAIVRPPSVARSERALRARARDVLRTVGLYDKRDQLAATLSGGQKKLLELARAVMADAQMLLMDEPTAGVNPALRDQLLEHISEVHQAGLTILLVEHNLSVIDQLCDDVVVMAGGTVLRRGRMDELRQDATVIEAYLGGVPANAAA